MPALLVWFTIGVLVTVYCLLLFYKHPDTCKNDVTKLIITEPLQFQLPTGSGIIWFRVSHLNRIILQRQVREPFHLFSFLLDILQVLKRKMAPSIIRVTT